MQVPKVLIFLPFLTRGGAETQGFLLAKGLSERGYSVEVCGFDLPLEKCTLIEDLKEAGIPFFLLPFKMDVVRSRKALPGVLWQFITLLRAKKFNVVIPYTWYPNLLSGVTYRLAGVQKCFWNQRNIEDHVPKNFLESLLPLSKMNFVSNSVPGRKFIERRFGLPTNKITVIRNGLPAKQAKHPAGYWTKTLHAEGKVVITMVANFFLEKDFITVIKAMALVAKQTKDVLLVFAGGGGSEPGANQAKALAFDLGLTDTVKFTGNVHDVPGLLSASHIGLLSSKAEGMPNSIMEYMNAGLPVIATSIEGIKDMLGDGYPYLFDVGDVDSLAGIVLNLVENSAARQSTGLMLKDKVVTEYSCPIMVNSFESLMKQE